MKKKPKRNSVYGNYDVHSEPAANGWNNFIQEMKKLTRQSYLTWLW